MSSKHLLTSAATAVLLMGVSSLSWAQTTVDTDQTTPIVTSTDGDVIISPGVTVSTDGGNIVTIDSDNTVESGGVIQAQDTDDVVGVLIEGGTTGGFTQTGGSILLTEDVTAEDSDDDGIVDGPFAQGNNRVGVLISGASPFTGNVDIQTGTISIEGNNSAGIRLSSESSIAGNIINTGALSITGNNSIGLDIEGSVIGELANNGFIITQGENSQAIRVQGDISEGFSNTGTISNTGLRFSTRPSLIARNLLDEEDTLQAGAAVEINGNVNEGIFLGQRTSTTTDADGNETTSVLSLSAISQFGGAPAVLVDGQGTMIALGVVSPISDPDDPDFDPNLQFGFVQQGTITANGVLDDSPATAVQFSNVDIANGIFNSGTISSSTFRSGDDGVADTGNFDGHSRGFFLNGNVTAQDFVNEGAILVNATEAADEVFQDRDDIIPARLVQATAIEISADSFFERIINSGLITSTVSARDGIATAIVDRSGTLTEVTNRGNIFALGVNSDATNTESASFTTVALDLSANTSGVTILQEDEPDVGSIFTPASPSIIGDILLGSGDDTVTSISGSISGDLDFGAGADVLSLSNTNFSGVLSDDDGVLEVDVANNSTLSHLSINPVNVTNANFDSSSTFETVIDGNTGQAGTLIASNDITFEDGASIGLALSNVLSVGTQTFEIASADNLTINGAIDQLDTSVSPFLYDVEYSLAANDPNTLVVTLDLRDTNELGLDTRQAASFTSAFQALASNAALGQTFTSITEQDEFNQAFNQLLPEISASPLYFIQANVDGAVGAVGSHLENARRSQDRSGGAWFEQFTYFADRELDELSEQFRGFGFGFAGGFDTSWGPFHTVGANVGFASTQVEDVLGVDEPLNLVTYQVGAYAGAERNNISLDLYAGVGLSDIESNRFISIGDFNGQANGEWTANHINGSARLGYTADIGERFWVRPAISVDYLRLDEESFRETGDAGLALGVASRTSDRAGVTALFNAGAVFNGNRTWIRPAIRAGYRTDFIADPVLTQFQFINLSDGAGNLFDGTLAETVSGDIASEAFILGFTVAAGSKWSSFSFDFDSDIRDGFIRHTGRVVVRLLF